MSYTVTEHYRTEYRVKGSKFHAFLSPATTNADIERIKGDIRNQHPTATHHCYGAVLLSPDRSEVSNDDGEPGGTAGLPILNVLKSSGIVNSVIVVVRYYGGTKLGKTGLIDAYSTATKQVTKVARLKRIISIQKWKIQYDYEHQSIIDKLKNDFTLYEMDAVYLEKVTLVLGVPNDRADEVLLKLRSVEHLLILVEKVGDSYFVQE